MNRIKYKKIYSAANITEAQLIEGLLSERSINAILHGDNLTIAAGALPADVFQIEILVDTDNILEALKIISKYEENLKLPSKGIQNWNCNACNTNNPDTFEICWSCQENRMNIY